MHAALQLCMQGALRDPAQRGAAQHTPCRPPRRPPQRRGTGRTAPVWWTPPASPHCTGSGGSARHPSRARISPLCQARWTSDNRPASLMESSPESCSGLQLVRPVLGVVAASETPASPDCLPKHIFLATVTTSASPAMRGLGELAAHLLLPALQPSCQLAHQSVGPAQPEPAGAPPGTLCARGRPASWRPRSGRSWRCLCGCPPRQSSRCCWAPARSAGRQQAA